MHDYSLPASDRFDRSDAGELPCDDAEAETRSAKVIRLADGSYYRARKSNRGYFTVRTLKAARLFFGGDAAELARILAKLELKGIAADVVQVRIRVDQN